MQAGTIVLVVLAVLLAALVFVALYRVAMLRRGGTAALVRRLPAAPGQGWRHGLVRYREDELVFFKLTSLRLGPDVRIDRLSVAIRNRRGPDPSEQDITTEETRIVGVHDGHRDYEFALDRGAVTAFSSWVESRPSRRSLRGRRR